MVHQGVQQVRYALGLRSGRRRSFTAVIVAAALSIATAVVLPAVVGAPAEAAPAAVVVDPAKVPHYFGPWTNWALSPLTTAEAAVTITSTRPGAAGAAATATVDPVTGAVVGIDVTAAGTGYTDATTSVQVTGAGSGTLAHAMTTATGAVTSYAVTAAGGGFTAFRVAVAASPAGVGTADATAAASGGVDAVTVAFGGQGYTAPVVEFDLPDQPDGVQAKGHVASTALGDVANGLDSLGAIAPSGIVVDDPGSGYTSAPGVVVHNGTVFDPVPFRTDVPTAGPATAASTLKLLAVAPVGFGSGYTLDPGVTVTDPVGAGANALVTAAVDAGGVTSVVVDTPGSGYVKSGIKKFQDSLPTTCDPAIAPTATGGCPEGDPTRKFIPIGVPEHKTYNGVEADEYVIGLVQYRTRFSSDLPPTLVRGYVQLETPANSSAGNGASEHFPLVNESLDPTQPATPTGYYGVTSPQWLGPIINATKDKPVRIVFRNLLPKGSGGDLFLPMDSSMMGSGMAPMTMGGVPAATGGTVTDSVRNPACTQQAKDPMMCFTDNRATLHLHGGITPWISDGTPHQWITPAGETTIWPQGVSVKNVPDMLDASGAAICDAADDGCQTFYYTNQQSARLMWYHDHSWGITRLNVYAGEAAGYVITDDTEKSLIATGTIPGAADTLPLIVQDRTFVPGDEQLKDVVDPTTGKTISYGQDPTWDAKRWGGKGSFWYHHVYMPAQNPGDPGGMSAYGRWMYGPWFWPPATGTTYGPIDNPYYDPTCVLDIPATWQYPTDPFCEPKQIPGTPNISAGMEQFNDTPLVNGVAYPTLTLDPKTYRLRMLNAANDRFFNFQWYVADSDPKNNGVNGTEVKLNATELAAAQTDPNISPTPADAHNNSAGPDWLQIGNEGGFLPQPTVVDGQQPTTWITDPTRFDVGNVDKHSMLLAPAERSDVLVDFSKFAGKTLILYNDAPAAFPARVPTYDYYTGAPDMSPNGAPKVLPGYGPNTRTVMQVKIAATAPAPAFDLAKLQAAFRHKANGTGVFESGQHPIIVGQAAYNSTYGTSFSGGSDCNTGTTTTTCDGLVRVNNTSSFAFNTLRSPTAKMTMPLQPKAIHDEMNSSTFDEFGRMQANLGIEAQPPTPGGQNVTLYPFVNPGTEFIDGTNLPTAGGTKVTPISTAADGTQIWRITHNGVDTHPIHFHLFDVQLLNRVTWDNIIIPPDPNELGWKDTVRTSPLEDTIVALRPVVPKVPFEVPNSVRNLNPMMPTGDTSMFNNVDIQGNPTAAITNQLVNFGWEYVYHCHILSHEEMDMMRPVSLALPPVTPDGVTVQTVAVAGTDRYQVGWNDNSITETSFDLQRSTDGTTWTTVGTIPSPLNAPNVHEPRSLVDPTSDTTVSYQYRVQANNAVGYGGDFPSMTVHSTSTAYTVGTLAPPLAPSGLTATLGTGPAVNLTWTDNAVTEASFTVERSLTGANAWTQVGTTAANTTTFTDPTVTAGTYDYRVGAKNAAGTTYGNIATIAVVAPLAPSGLTATLANGPSAALTWVDVANNETGYRVDRAPTGSTTWTGVATLPANAATFTDPGVTAGTTYDYRVVAVNQVGETPSPTTTLAVLPPPAPTALTGTIAAGPLVNLTWKDNATNEIGYTIQRSADNGATWATVQSLPADAASATDGSGLLLGVTYTYRVGVTNYVGTTWSTVIPVDLALAAVPSALTATLVAATLTAGPRVSLAWTDNATNETGTVVQRSIDGGTTWTTVVTLAATAGTGTQTSSDPAPVVGTTNRYRVGAANILGYAWSATAQVAVAALSTAPSSFAALLQAGPQVRLTWTDSSTDETAFSVQRSADNGTTWTQLVTRPARAGTGTNLAWTDTTVTLAATYVYRVGARSSSGSPTPRS